MNAPKTQNTPRDGDEKTNNNNNTIDPESGSSNGGGYDRNQDKAEVDVLSGLSLVLMAIFFICGTYFLQRKTRTNLKYPFVFLLAGSIFYLLHGSLELYKKLHDNKVEGVISILTLTAGGLWFIASTFLFRDLFFLSAFTISFVIWSSLWLVGSALNIVSITCNFVMMMTATTMTMTTNKSTMERPIFLVASLVLSWFANILFCSGCAIFIKIYDQGGNLVEYDSFSKLLVAASVILFLHSVCYTWHYLSVEY